MRSFNSLGWFDISGRGLLAVVDTQDLHGQRGLQVSEEVLIDDESFIVKGLEKSVGLNSSNTIVGVLVQKATTPGSLLRFAAEAVDGGNSCCKAACEKIAAWLKDHPDVK